MYLCNNNKKELKKVYYSYYYTKEMLHKIAYFYNSIVNNLKHLNSQLRYEKR